MKESLGDWHKTYPTPQHRSYVNEFLMDLVRLGSFECGEEDDDTGIFTGIAGSMIVIVCVPDFERRRIAVTGIALAG